MNIESKPQGEAMPQLSNAEIQEVHNALAGIKRATLEAQGYKASFQTQVQRTLSTLKNWDWSEDRLDLAKSFLLSTESNIEPAE